MMNFLPQGYSFESYSNPYQSQFISPYYGSGQYGRQYSPMAQNGPRLPTCQPGTCPPWLPPGIIATPSSGVQELSVLMDPTLASRMARAYNTWSVPYWGKPDIPAWLWPDGASTQPVPPNVFCDAVPVPPGGGGGRPGGGGGPGLTPGPAPSPQLTPGPTAPPSSTPSPGPSLTPGVVPQGSLTPGPSGPQISSMPAPSSFPPSPNPTHRHRNPGVPSCGGAGSKCGCYRCCTEKSTSKSQRQQCLNQCVALPQPKPQRAGISRLVVSRRRANGRIARSLGRRLRKGVVATSVRAKRATRSTSGWVAVPGDTRGWCGPGEYLCTKKTPKGKSHFCCCRNGSSECSGGKSVLAAA